MLGKQLKPLKAVGWLAFLLVLGLTSCSSIAPIPTPAVTSTGLLTPYWTPTPTGTSPPPLPLARSATPPPSPTPTPRTHTIVQGDTMLGIALRYGISLEELREANPEVDPRMLSIDTVLVVPFGESEPQALPAPTPLPLPLEDPECYLNAEGGAWCLLLVKNNYQRALENLSAWINLYSPEGESVAVEEAVSPLNVLPPGEALPLVALFPPPLPEEFIPLAERFAALPVPGDDSRYLEAGLQLDQVVIDPAGLSATVQGQIILPEGGPAAGLVWLAAVAYGEDGEVVGVRKWEIEQPCVALEQPEPAGSTTPAASPEDVAQEQLPQVSCKPVPFEITVYSLGPPIEQVEVLVEARP